MKIRIFGDSHCRRFKLSRQLRSAYPELQKFRAQIHDFAGGSVAGFGNRQSTLSVRDKITEHIDGLEDRIVLAFGQVDVEMGLHYRRIVKGDNTPKDKIFRRIIEHYITFIQSLSFPTEKILVKGINPTVLCYSKDKALRYTARTINENIKDQDLAASYYKKLEDDFPTALRRISFHRAFNEMLKAHCLEARILYFDIFEELIDPETKLTHRRFIPFKRDHHLSDSLETSALHWKALSQAIDAGCR